VVDVPFLRVLLAALVGWLDRQQQEACEGFEPVNGPSCLSSIDE
jgi:hypothetical protein